MAEVSLESSFLSSERTSVKARTAAVYNSQHFPSSFSTGLGIPYLLVDDGTEPGLALDDGVWDTHLAAEGGEEDHQLNGVNVVGDQDEGSLLVLDEANNVVETELGSVGLLGNILLLLALGDGGSLLGETLLLLGLGLRSVLVEELESRGGGCFALAGVEPTPVVEHLLLRSRTCWNWEMDGGTFKRMLRIFFWR